MDGPEAIQTGHAVAIAVGAVARPRLQTEVPIRIEVAEATLTGDGATEAVSEGHQEAVFACKEGTLFPHMSDPSHRSYLLQGFHAK